MAKTIKINEGFKVLTPEGFVDFAGVSLMGQKEIYLIEFSDNTELECTIDHKLYVNDTTAKPLSELSVGDQLLSKNGVTTITAITQTNKVKPVYDLIEVGTKHRYYTNSILSSNCEFLIYDETLISSDKLSKMFGREPLYKLNQVRWYKKPEPGYIYLAGWDPAMGTGGDYSAIQIFELPSFTQVAEWHHNVTPIQGQAVVLRDMLRHVLDCIGHEYNNSIYWSVENNTLGEAGLIVIEDLGEATYPGMWLSEPIRKGHVRTYRKGFNTTYGSKISACSRLKFYIEEDKMQVMSKALVSELKTFIAHGHSYKSKTGANDDLISALLLVIRMSVILAEWDLTVFDTISIKGHFDDDWEPPLPIYITAY